MRPKWQWLFIAPAVLLGITLVLFIGGEAVRLLWNWLLPPLFGWREVTFWQGLGLLVLCRLLFGGCGLRGSSRSGSPIRGRIVDRMADRVAERWQQMTPEERDRFRQRMRERCGIDLAGGDQQPNPSPPV